MGQNICGNLHFYVPVMCKRGIERLLELGPQKPHPACEPKLTLEPKTARRNYHGRPGTAPLASTFLSLAASDKDYSSKP